MPHVNVGRYTVRPGDTPASVAANVLNDPKLAVSLVEANEGNWGAGDVLDVPGRSGTLIEAREGEQVSMLARRVFNGTGATPAIISTFQLWNGGASRKVTAGDEVFFVDARSLSGF